MASGSFAGGYNRVRGGGGRAGRNGTRRLKYSQAMSRRAGDSYMAMNRANRVRGQRNATVRSSAFLPF